MSNSNDFQTDKILFPVRASVVIGIIGLFLIIIYAWKVGDFDKSLVFIALLTAGFGQVAVSFYTARTLAAIVRRDQQDKDRALGDRQQANTQQKQALERQERLDAAAETRFRLADEAESRRIQFEKKKEALLFGSRWNNPSMASARDTLREVSSKRASPQEVIDFAKQNVTSINHIMNFLEEIATACRSELVDTALMKDQFDFVVTHTWETLYVWIIKVRESNSKDIWEDVERLAQQWKRH